MVNKISGACIERGNAMGFFEKIFGNRAVISTMIANGEFVYLCHDCHKHARAGYEDSGKEAKCQNCGIELVIPPRIGQQITWVEELQPIQGFPSSAIQDVFVPLESEQLHKLLIALNVKRSKIDYMWVSGREIPFDGAPVLKLDLSENSDLTGSIPILERRSILGEKILRYALLFIKGENRKVYCAADDGEIQQIIPSFRTEKILLTIIKNVNAGQVQWDESQKLIKENHAVAEQYEKQFSKNLDKYLEIPKIDRNVDYDQLLIFEPVFSGYYAKYGITAEKVKTVDDFGTLMCSLPIANEEKVLAHYSRDGNKHTDIGKVTIGKAIQLGFNFWSNGKLPQRIELYQGKRQIGLGNRPDELLKIDQIVNGLFNQMYVARIQRNEFFFWYTLGGA